MIRKELQNYFLKLDSEIKPVDEFSVGEKIGEILDIKKVKTSDKEEVADYIAFQFVPNYNNKENSWGTYFGPKIVWKDDGGKFIEFPSIQQVNEYVLTYWRKRIDEFKNPILVYCYANLVFDFEPVILKKNIDFKLAQKIIDRGIDICFEGLNDGLGCRFKLERCLKLALQINDAERVRKLKNIIFDTEIKYAEDNKPGLWGYTFQWLILDDNKNIVLSDEDKTKIIANIEERLERLMSVDNPDPWHVECVVRLLAPYYFIKKDEANLKRVLLSFEQAFRKNQYSNSDGMLISNYLEKLIDIYSEYLSFQFSKESRDRIVNELSNLGDSGKFDGHEISVETEIKNEDIDKFLASIFGDNDSNLISKVIGKIAVNFVLKKDIVENQLNDLSKNYPLSYLMGHVLASEDGYPIVKFGSITDDYDKHLLENFSRNLHFQAVFLGMAFERMRKLFTPEIVTEMILLSPIFRKEDDDYILKLFRSFWGKDYLGACCLSIPLIEDAIRNLFRINGQTYIVRNEEGGYDVLGLARLLRHGLLRETFQIMGDDIEYYFRALLTERTGWNLRNNFAHGINKRLFENEDVANRLIHVLFCLSLIRKNE